MKTFLTISTSIILAGLAMTSTASADEAAVLKACEMSLCSVIANKNPEGENVKCDVTKTWGKKEISEGTIGKTFKWSWGDAKCAVNVELNRKGIVNALTSDAGELSVPSTPVTCQIGSADAKDALNFTLAPKMTFEKGQAKTVALGLDNIKGPFMQRVALKTAALVDRTKILQGLIVGEVNRFVKKCPGRVAQAK